MRYLRRLVAVFLMVWSCVPSIGQIYKYVGLEEGLSSRNVYGVEQSNGGFMWFLTDNGIDRYDGTNMSNYTIEIGGKKFTEYSTSKLIYDAQEDNIWVASHLGRIVEYDKRNNRFNVVYSPQVSASKADISECAVSPIDPSGNIWIFVGDEAFSYNIRTREGRSLTISSSIGNKDYSAVIPKDSTTLYIGTKRSVHLGHIHGDTLIMEAIPTLQEYRINANTLFYNAKHQTLLIGTEDAGIIAYKEKTGQIIHYRNELPDVRITKILPFYGSDDEVLFSTNAACVYRMNINDCVPIPYLQADFTTDYRMNTDNIADMCIDMDGQLWMCSFPKGLTIRNAHYPEFNWIRRSILSSNTLIDNGIDCILEDSQHDLWYATDNGISLYNTGNDQWHTLLSMADELPNPNHYFLTMCEVVPGIILAGGYASGIYIINKHTLQAQFIRPAPMVPEKYIQTMYKDPADGSVWMGGENQLFNISYDNGIRVNYAEVFGGINYITHKDNERLWIGTKDGIYLFNKRTHEKRRIELPLERFRVNTLFQDTDGTIYIGTHHHGLIVFNEDENYYHRYSKENSALTNNCMKCIINANNGSLYISTDGGIVRFNRNTNRITTWTNDQGLEGINFSIRSGIRTQRGTLMFGGDYGVIEVSEEVSLPHIYKSNLILADLYIGNTRVAPDDEDSPLTDAINNMKLLELPNSQRNAAIKVKNINHLYPSDCQIAWSTNAKSKRAKWKRLDEDNFITLSGLKPGKHLLTIRSTSKESGKILDEHVLRLVIRPPFYLSFWGLLLEGAFVFLIFILFIKYERSSTAIHISDEKIRFFINTAHDLRTPLTLIKAPLEELNESATLNAGEREAIALALRNTNTLAEMTNKVMQYEIDSIEKGVLRIEKHEAIEHIAKQIERWQMLAQNKQQQIKYIHPEKPFYIWVDIRKLNSIIQNLLSNAIKYSSEKQTITFTLYEEEKVWGFHVIDNGIGIHTDEQKKLFRQFFRGTNAINAKVLGSGIGLLSIGQYIKSMKGKIEVRSQINNGSDFHISFPTGKAHYAPHTTLFVENPHEGNPLPTSPTFESDQDKDTDNRIRLLIVEDNPELLAYLSQMFSKEYRVYTATNGKEALSKLPYIQPSIVLTDVMMPEMRGDDLCVSIKSNIDTSHIAVVLISALSDQQSIIKGLAVKADAYVTKPFDMKILQLTISNLVENRRMLSERLTTLEDFSYNTLDVSTSELDLKLLKEMKDIIEKNIADCDFTIDVLAYQLRISRTTLYNKIKGLTGNTPSDLIRTCRINKAKTLLRERNNTVTEVAELVGFADHKYFREVFKKATGMTPSEYAKGKNEHSQPQP